MLNTIIETLIRQWQFDVGVMSQPWMYWCLFPILFYVPFFFLKWVILTFPFWMPFILVASVFGELVLAMQKKQQG